MVFILGIVFLIWPLGAVLLSFRYYTKWTKNIIWAFVIFYGYLFVLSNDTMDANSILRKFQYFLYRDLNFNEVIRYFYFENRDGVDIIQPIILYLASKITSDFQVLMAVLAVILGFFYSRNIDYLLEKSEGKINKINYILIWMFILVVGFWEINMFRFWTSALAFFYSITPFIYEGKKKRLWLLCFIPLLHFSFLFPVFVFAVFVIFKKRFKLFFLIFLVSLFVTSANTEIIGDMLTRVLPANFHRKIAAYTSATYAAEVAAVETSVSKYLRLSMFTILNAAFVFLYFGYQQQIRSNKGLFRLFSFCLLIMAAGNFASIIPSGDRFQYLSALFSLAFLFFFVQIFGLKGKFKIFFHLSIPILFLASFGLIRLAMNTIDVLVILGNPVIAAFVNSQMALIDLIL